MRGNFHGLLIGGLLVLLFTIPVNASAFEPAVDGAQVRIGVLAIRGKAAAEKSWRQTATHLESIVPAYRFQIVPLTIDEAEQAVRDKKIDFLITNTGQYITLEYQQAISRLATLRNLRQGRPYSSFGAVIFTRADRSDINTLADLRNRTFMAVEDNAFGGFQMAWYEMHRQGLDPFEHFAKLEFSGFPQDQIPLAVLQGKVDAGTVRTDVLERMAAAGLFRLDQFKIINRRHADEFPFLLSTDLYPEWPFAKLLHVDNELAKKVQLALLIMDEKSPAARMAHSAGWTVPLDYSGAHKMMKALHIGPYVDSKRGAIDRILHEYWVLILVLALVSVPPFWYYVIRLYINARTSERNRKQAETEWLQGMDLLSEPTMLLDLEDRIVRANRAFLDRIQKTHDQAVGRKVTDFFHPDGESVPCKVCRARHALKDAVVTVEEDEPQNHHGRPMEITIRVVRDSAGAPVRVIQSIRDLTEVRAREHALRKDNLILQQIVRSTARTVEEDYFHDLVRVVAETLAVNYAFVSEIVDPDHITRVRAFALWGKGEFLPPVEYELAGTPCENVVDNTVCFYGDGVQQLFPEDRMLVDLGVRSYLGVPFFDSTGKPLGHIAVMHGQPLEEQDRYSAIMQIFADRVGAEVERLRSHEALEESEERFKGLFDTAPDPTIIVDEAGKIVLANSRFEEQFGFTKEEIIGRAVEMLIPEEMRAHHPKMRSAYLHKPLSREMGNRPELLALKKDGTEFAAEISLSPLVTRNGTFVTAVIRDVTARKQAELELERLASFPMMSPIPVMEVDLEGHLTYENPVSSRLFPELYKLGFDHPLLQDINSVIHDLKSGMRSVVRDVTVDGAIYEQQLSFIEESQQLRIYSWDVTNLHEMTKQMHFQATHDVLTGLLNRREFEQNLERSIQSAVYEDKTHTLCYIDLDQFKLVNDTCGHGAGDELLRQLTAVLKKQVRDSDSLARLGGDEFGLLLTGCPVDRARQLADKLRKTIAGFEFVWENQSFRVGASIGLVEVNRSSGGLAEVLSAADSACYAAKELGRNRLFVYHPDDAVVSRNVSEMNWTHRIRQALDHDEFLLFYQTIESLKDPDTRNCEILVRMVDVDGQLVLPGAFIPAAERFGMMGEIDLWVVSHSMDIIRLDENRFESYSINLSGQSLGDPSTMNEIIEIITDSGIDPVKICFEITETAMISSFTAAERYIRAIRGLGCQFALDDFGTGLSSFSYLKSLPVDRLKIDSHFVRDILDDEVNATMVMSINIVGHSMNLQTVAEGVEDKEIAVMLREFGVDYVQGYAYSRPELFTGQCVPITQSRKTMAQ